MERASSSKLELLKGIYNRPTDGQAIVEAMKDYSKNSTVPIPLAALASQATKEADTELKDRSST